jgi:rhodanese-related sulfurtransferase
MYSAHARENPRSTHRMLRRFILNANKLILSPAAIRSSSSSSSSSSLSSSSSSTTTMAANAQALDVTKEQVAKWIEEKRADPKKKFVLIDCRKDEELAHGTLPLSVHLPLADLESALKMTPAEFERKYGFAKPDAKQDHVVFYCRSGARAEKAALQFRASGYERAQNYRGSFKEWFGWVYP